MCPVQVKFSVAGLQQNNSSPSIFANTRVTVILLCVWHDVQTSRILLKNAEGVQNAVTCLLFPSILHRAIFASLRFCVLLNTCLSQVPTSICSPECPLGHARKQFGIQKCCFNCEICPNGTYTNNTGKLLYTWKNIREMKAE